jgi:CubicO group peptidase (beta-lactamase class C family)
MKIRFFFPLLLAVAVVFTSGSCTASTTGTGTGDYWPTKGWRTSRPEKQGLDSERLGEIKGYIQAELPHMSSIVVVRNGYLVFEEYYRGDKDTLRSLYSGTKSIISALVGMLLGDGLVGSVDDKITEYLPESMTQNVSAGASEMTVRHLLTMTSGIPFTYISDIFLNDLSTTILSELTENKPGERFEYKSPNVDFLSVMITETTGLKASQYARERLFSPLGIKDYSWLDYKDYSMGTAGLQLKSRDAAKIGYLYLNKGLWEGTQLIAQSYIEDTVKWQVEVPPDGNIWSVENLHYGYLYWLWPMKGYSVYSPVGGMGGQYLGCVFPELDMIVVITAEGNYFEKINPLGVIEDYILEAIVS